MRTLQLVELFYIGMPVVHTDGRAYDHVITKFSRIGRLPHFLTHGAPLSAFRVLSAPLLLVHVQSTPDNSNLHTKLKKGSSYWEFEENSQE